MAMPDAAIIPPITVEPRIRRATAPEPVANHNGKSPKMKAKEVIRIGRKRKRAPSSAASSKRFAFFVFGLGEFDNQNGIFRGEADEHDQTDLRVDVIFHTAQHRVEESAEHRDRRA